MNEKKAYVAPVVEVSFIEMEEGIASASARIRSGNNNEVVQEEWYQDADDNRTTEW